MRKKCLLIFSLIAIFVVGVLLLHPQWGENWAHRLGMERLALAFGAPPAGDVPQYRAEDYRGGDSSLAVSYYEDTADHSTADSAGNEHPYYAAGRQRSDRFPAPTSSPSETIGRQVSNHVPNSSSTPSPYGPTPYGGSPSVGQTSPPAIGGTSTSSTTGRSSSQRSPADSNRARPPMSNSRTGRQHLPPDARMELNPSIVAEWEPCEGTRTLARVGTHCILGSDVLPEARKLAEKEFEKRYREVSETERKKITPDVREKLLNVMTQQLVPMILDQQVRTTLLYLDATADIPEEGKEKQREMLSELFETKLLPQKMKAEGLKTHRELVEHYKQYGSTIEREKRQFMKAQIAIEWERQRLQSSEEISHQDMLDYYHAHREDFHHTGKAQWQQLSAKFSEYASREQAHQAISQMQQLVLGGMPLAEVAHKYSDGITAQKGGLRDWTLQGSLRSDAINQALFRLPVGRLSRILQDEQGFHIVRVLQRQDPYYTSFEKAQEKIREKITQQRKEKRAQTVLAELKKKYPVETYLDDLQTADRRNQSAAYQKRENNRASPPNIGR